MRLNPTPSADDQCTSQCEEALGAQLIPKWVCDALGAPAGNIVKAVVENAPEYELEPKAPNDPPPAYLYHVLLEYFASYAVDVDEPVEPIEPAESDSEADPNSEVRKVTGRLSALMITETFALDLAKRRGVVFNSDVAPEPPTADFRLGLGRARVQINGKDVCILHTTRGAPVSIDNRITQYRELQLFAVNTHTLKQLADGAFKWDFERHQPDVCMKGKYMLYTFRRVESTCEWKEEGLRMGRSLSSIVLPEGLLDDIVDDFREFVAPDTKKWYSDVGLPYRRCYLFYGPNGSGKTSVIRAIAAELQLPICDLTLGMRDIGSMDLMQALNEVPKPSILVVEDIDQLTFSVPGMLNALDGLVSTEGIITVLTTSDIDSLDELDDSLLRAGRISRQFELKRPVSDQIGQLFAKFYPDADKALARRFANLISERKEKGAKSFATVQELFIFNRRKSAEECVDGIETFFTKFYPNAKNKDQMFLYQ